MVQFQPLRPSSHENGKDQNRMEGNFPKGFQTAMDRCEVMIPSSLEIKPVERKAPIKYLHED